MGARNLVAAALVAALVVGGVFGLLLAQAGDPRGAAVPARRLEESALLHALRELRSAVDALRESLPEGAAPPPSAPGAPVTVPRPRVPLGERGDVAELSRRIAELTRVLAAREGSAPSPELHPNGPVPDRRQLVPLDAAGDTDSKLSSRRHLWWTAERMLARYGPPEATFIDKSGNPRWIYHADGRDESPGVTVVLTGGRVAGVY